MTADNGVGLYVGDREEEREDYGCRKGSSACAAPFSGQTDA